MKRKSKLIIFVLMSIIVLLSIILGIIIYQLHKRETTNTYAYLVSSESNSAILNTEFAEKIEIQFLKIDKKSQTAKVQVKFPDLKKILKKVDKNTKSDLQKMLGKAEYAEVTLDVKVKKNQNIWQIISPEVIDEAVFKNINEGFDVIIEELGTIELGVE